jgi:CBS domain-containing protein
MQVSEVMHKGVSSVTINDSIKKVAELMKSEDIGAVPVLDGSKPVGIITDRDIVINCVADGSDLNGSIENVMTGDVVCVSEDQDVAEASKLMAEKQISRVIVVDKSQKPVGMVSLHDLAQESEDLTEETVSHIKQ